jgi:hypothetical protein
MRNSRGTNDRLGARQGTALAAAFWEASGHCGVFYEITT